MGLQGELAKQMIDRFPSASSRTLANLLYEENPGVFMSREAARGAIRYHRGESGQRDRDKLMDRSRMREDSPISPFPELPEGLKHFDDWAPMELSEARTLVMSDLHVPYHDKAAVEVAVAYGRTAGVDAILLLGDVHDMFSCSFWEKDPRKRDFQREVSMGRALYEYLRAKFPGIPVRMKVGNHEERYSRYMAVKAPELLGVDSFDLAHIMHMEQHGVEIIPDRRILKIGKLHIVHGHEFGKSVFSPVNPARGLYLRGKDNALCGHYHMTSDHTEKSISEKVVRCWSIGTLADLHPDYSPINRWNHGFAVVEQWAGGTFRVDNVTIIDGKVY